MYNHPYHKSLNPHAIPNLKRSIARELVLGLPAPNHLDLVVPVYSRVSELPTNVSRIYRHLFLRPPEHISHIKYVALDILVNGDGRARSDFLELRILGPPS